MSKTENILLEYQKTIPKSLRIITNIIHTAFFKQLDNLDKYSTNLIYQIKEIIDNFVLRKAKLCFS